MGIFNSTWSVDVKQWEQQLTISYIVRTTVKEQKIIFWRSHNMCNVYTNKILHKYDEE